MTKIALYFLIIVFLQGCFPVSFYKNAYAGSINFFNPAKYQITPAIINLPYATQLVEHNKNTMAMVLAYVDNQNLLSFVDEKGRSFTFYFGKIISSNLFENNLDIKSPPNIKEIFLRLLNSNVNFVEHESLVKYTNPKTPYFLMKLNYSVSSQPNDLFIRKIDETKVSYYILEEDFEVPSIYWKGRNTYWLDQKGNILKSKQLIFPNQSRYYIETLKMYLPQ